METPSPSPWAAPDSGGSGPGPYAGHPPPLGSPPYGSAPLPYPIPYGYPPPEPDRPWTAQPPPGMRYHQLARTPAHRWWRPLAGTLFLAAVGLLVLLGIGMAGMVVYALQHNGRLPLPKGDGLFGNPTADLAFELISLAALLPVVFLAALVTQRRRPGTLSSVAGRLRWGWLAVCCGLALVFLAISFGWSYAVTALFTHDPVALPKWAGWKGFVAPAVVIVLLVPFQATAEEYLFRGWFVQAIASWVPPRWTNWFARMLAVWPALLISAALFTLGHGYTGWAMADTYFFGLVAGWLAIRTGGLEAGIALHTFNNLYAFLLPTAAGQLVDALKQGGAPWQDLLSDAVPLVLYAAAVILVARRRGVRNRTD